MSSAASVVLVGAEGHVDTQELAARALGALVPHLGHLAAHAGERITDTAVDHLYRLIKSRLSADQDSDTALARLQAQPQDVQRQAIVKTVLAEAIATDPVFAQALAATVDQLEPSVGTLVNQLGSTIGQLGSAITSVTLKRMNRSQFSMGSMTVTNRQTRVSMFWIGVALVVVAVLAISAVTVGPKVPVVNRLPVISSLASQRDPAKVVESFYRYWGNGDVKSACKLVDSDYRVALLQAANGTTLNIRSCEEYLTVLLNVFDTEDKRAIRSVKVRHASVNGNIAIVRNRDVTLPPGLLDSSQSAPEDPDAEAVRLLKKNGKWYLHEDSS